MWQTVSSQTAVVDSLKHQLSKVTSGNDSIRLLYDIYDLSTRAELRTNAHTLYDVAKRHGDLRTQLDMLRHLSNIYLGNDSMQAIFESEALKLPVDAEQRETVTFIKMQRISSASNYGSENDRIKELSRILANNEATSKNADIYTKIVNLFSVCAYLGQISRGELLVEYLNELEELIKELPYQLSAIRNQFYTQAAILYTYAGDVKRAGNADTELLRLIDQLESTYRAQGRMYRSYDTHRYICYRRILTNFKDLPTETVDRVYTLINEITSRNADLKADNERMPRSQVSYLMKHERYAEAIPLIQKILQKETKPRERRFYLRMMKEAATATGDTEALLAGALDYNNLLEEYIDLKSNESYREMQVRYDLAKLEEQNEQLAHEQATATETAHFWILGCAGLVVLMLVALIVLISINNRKARQLTISLQESYDILSKERDQLAFTQKELMDARDRAKRAENLKNDFIAKISHEIVTPVEVIDEYSTVIFDCIDAERKKYLEKFVTAVKLNCELLKHLIFDVLGLSQHDNSKAFVEISAISAKDICHKALAIVKPQLRPGVKLLFNESTPDVEITADENRVVKVLDNLLSNAAKFTNEGSITLAYELIDNGERIQFSVADTGLGIPPAMAQSIFERFKQLNPQTQGIGLGLPTCRMLATLMKGDVMLDTTYTSGARFTFTIPVNI